MELKRSNKLTVTTTNGHMAGKFALTHKDLVTILDNETRFVPSANANPTLVRETFRLYLMDNASEYGIKWDPEDRRTEDNMMPKRYDSDQLLMDTAVKMTRTDIEEWIAKLNLSNKGLYILAQADTDEVRPIMEYNLKKVSPKYANGAWGWAAVEITFGVEDTNKVQAYLTMDCLLVSGQLKKPSKIGEQGYNFTGMVKELSTVFPTLVEVAATKKEPVVKTATITSVEFLASVDALKAAGAK